MFFLYYEMIYLQLFYLYKVKIFLLPKETRGRVREKGRQGPREWKIQLKTTTIIIDENITDICKAGLLLLGFLKMDIAIESKHTAYYWQWI